MILSVFCVRDRATLQYGTPMFLISEGQAIRGFTDEVNRADKDNQMFNHPDDFDLYKLGTFNTESGVFDVTVPVVLVLGKSVKVRN